jgi:hypothetical protein
MFEYTVFNNHTNLPKNKTGREGMYCTTSRLAHFKTLPHTSKHVDHCTTFLIFLTVLSQQKPTAKDEKTENSEEKGRELKILLINVQKMRR